jgi:hypothetical protein
LKLSERRTYGRRRLDIVKEDDDSGSMSRRRGKISPDPVEMRT